MDEIIAKVELSAEIARIALACPSCCESVRQLIIRGKNRNCSHNHPEGGPSSYRMTELEHHESFSRENI